MLICINVTRSTLPNVHYQEFECLLTSCADLLVSDLRWICGCLNMACILNWSLLDRHRSSDYAFSSSGSDIVPVCYLFACGLDSPCLVPVQAFHLEVVQIGTYHLQIPYKHRYCCVWSSDLDDGELLAGIVGTWLSSKNSEKNVSLSCRLRFEADRVCVDRVYTDNCNAWPFCEIYLFLITRMGIVLRLCVSLIFQKDNRNWARKIWPAQVYVWNLLYRYVGTSSQVMEVVENYVGG